MDFTPHGIRFVKLGCPQNKIDLLKFFGFIFLLQKPAFRTNCILQMRILICTTAILEPNVEQEICVVSSFNFQQIKHNHKLLIKRYCNLSSNLSHFCLHSPHRIRTIISPQKHHKLNRIRIVQEKEGERAIITISDLNC